MTAYRYTAPYNAYYVEYGLEAISGLVVDLPSDPGDGHWEAVPDKVAAPAATDTVLPVEQGK